MAKSFYRDKVALITGGSRGLGLEIARQICQRGGRVVILARDANELRAATTNLKGKMGEVLAFRCDLLETGQIQGVVRQTIERFGQIDILVNNAGTIEV